MCSPAVAARAAGRTLAEFLKTEELLHVLVDGEAHDHLWTEYAARQGIPIPASQGMTFESFVFAAEYAAGGSGVALGDADTLTDERLARPFPDESAELDFGYYLITGADSGDDPMIETFRRWVVDRLRPA